MRWSNSGVLIAVWRADSPQECRLTTLPAPWRRATLNGCRRSRPRMRMFLNDRIPVSPRYWMPGFNRSPTKTFPNVLAGRTMSYIGKRVSPQRMFIPIRQPISKAGPNELVGILAMQGQLDCWSAAMGDRHRTVVAELSGLADYASNLPAASLQYVATMSVTRLG